jgi:hypothetical protein
LPVIVPAGGPAAWAGAINDLDFLRKVFCTLPPREKSSSLNPGLTFLAPVKADLRADPGNSQGPRPVTQFFSGATFLSGILAILVARGGDKLRGGCAE